MTFINQPMPVKMYIIKKEVIMAYADNYTKQKKKLFDKIVKKETENAKILINKLDLSNEELKMFYEKLAIHTITCKELEKIKKNKGGCLWKTKQQ